MVIRHRPLVVAAYCPALLASLSCQASKYSLGCQFASTPPPLHVWRSLQNRLIFYCCWGSFLSAFNHITARLASRLQSVSDLVHAGLLDSVTRKTREKKPLVNMSTSMAPAAPSTDFSTLQSHPATAAQARAFTGVGSLSMPGGLQEHTPPSGEADKRNANGQPAGTGVTPATPVATPVATTQGGSGLTPTLQYVPPHTVCC